MHCGRKVMYFYWELTVFFFIHQSVRKHSHTNSYNFAMTLISQDDHLTAGTWVACGMRDLANASLWSRKWWSKLKTTFLFLSVYSNWTRDASLHPYCSPNIWHPTRGIDGCTFYFSPIFKLLGKFFTRPQHSCQTSSMGLRINLGRLHQFPAQNFQRRAWETLHVLLRKTCEKKLKQY